MCVSKTQTHACLTRRRDLHAHFGPHIFDLYCIPVDSKSAKEGLKSFVEWLKAKEMPVVLFAHNAKSFDCKHIIYSLQKHDLLNSFQSCVVGFVDTLILFKAILPQRNTHRKVLCQICWVFLTALMTPWKMSGLFSDLFYTRK